MLSFTDQHGFLLRLLLFGKYGQIGWELERSLSPLGSVQALSHANADLTNTSLIRATIRDSRPDIVLNAAAYTAVDRAETHTELVFAINADGPGTLAAECARVGALLVHYSTDYVFDGASAKPYTESDVPAPLNVYGESKAAGDRAIAESGCAHMIFRTSWVYASRGTNFVRTMLNLAAQRKPVNVVDDQIGAPTSARQIAEATAHALARARPARGSGNSLPAQFQGVFHLSAAGSTSWHGFAVAIFRMAGIAPPSLTALRTEDFPRPARRPKHSLLSNERFERSFGFRLPDWTIGLALCVDELRDTEH